MLITEKFTFAGPPKCGCTWMVRLCEAAGVPMQRKASAAVHTPGREYGKPSLTFIRHPADWLRSYYDTIRWPLGFGRFDKLRDLVWRDGAAEFVRDYVRRMPGLASELFSAYESDHVLRLDRVHIDLPPLLREWGLATAAEHASAQDAVNVTTEPSQLPDDLRNEVLAAEIGYFGRFGYEL